MQYLKKRIMLFRCLYAPRHTAYKTKKIIFIWKYGGREYCSKSEKPPPAKRCFFCGLLRLLYQAAEFVDFYKFGCFLLPTPKDKREPRCRSPPPERLIVAFQTFWRENMWQRNDEDIKDELEIRFTGYVIQAVKRTQRDYLVSLYKDSKQEVLTEEIYAIGKTLEQEVMEQMPFWETIEDSAILYALKQLNEREREILLGRILDERSFDQLGAKRGLTYKGAAAVYYRALKKVRRIIKEVNDRDI